MSDRIPPRHRACASRHRTGNPPPERIPLRDADELREWLVVREAARQGLLLPRDLIRKPRRWARSWPLSYLVPRRSEREVDR